MFDLIAAEVFGGDFNRFGVVVVSGDFFGSKFLGGDGEDTCSGSEVEAGPAGLAGTGFID